MDRFHIAKKTDVDDSLGKALRCLSLDIATDVVGFLHGPKAKG
jgi:hypothetical protein